MIKVIDITDIKNLINTIDEINKLDFREMVFYENGSQIDVDDVVFDKWKYIGLDNIEFIRSEFYKIHNDQK